MEKLKKAITIKANAKINLTLEVTGKRPDGYHELRSIMQSVSLHDMVTVSAEGESTVISCDKPFIPCDERNIAFKAAEAFFKEHGSRFGVKIHIEKHIPSEAGLGGGSADGAAVLAALNILSGKPFTEEKLIDIGARVGADIPFCLKGGTQLCMGIGEIMEENSSLPLCHIVIAKGNEGISTAKAFTAIDAYGFDKAPLDLSVFEQGSIEKIAAKCMNDFEKAADIPEIHTIKNTMLSYGALCSVLSGSGSAVYGIFTDSSAANSCCQKLLKSGFFAFQSLPEKQGLIY